MGSLIALKNFAHGRIRTVVALAGLTFAITLLFMELGLFETVRSTAMLVYDRLDFDLVLTSRRYVFMTQAGTLPRARLHQAKGHAAVEAVWPMHTGRHYWRNPDTRLRRAVVIVGVNPSDPVVRGLPELEQELPDLAREDTVLVDRWTREEVGAGRVGLVTEVGHRNLETVGLFTIGPGFEAGLVFVGEQTFSRIFIDRPHDSVSLGLVKLRPGADPDAVAADLRESLPPDVQVLTRAELARLEQHYWLVNTSTGVIVGCGLIIAILFGTVITYQVLFQEVSHRLAEYATLKAIGFGDGFVAGVVLRQAALFAVISYTLGLLVALGLYAVTAEATRLPIGMNVERAAWVLVLSPLMCGVSGVLALRNLRRADPAELLFP